MKRIIVTTIMMLAAVLFSGACSRSRLFGLKIEGSGQLVQRTVDVGKYEGVSARRGVQVEIVEGSGGVTVEADENLIDYVRVSVSHGVLAATLSSAVNSTTEAAVRVIVPDNGAIRKLDAADAASIRALTPLRAEKMRVKASDAAFIGGTLRCDECEIDASSASRIEVYVAGDECEVECSSAAHVGVALDVIRCDVDASSAAGVVLVGSAHALSFDLSSSAGLDAARLVARLCKGKTSSAARATLHCDQSLEVSASSGSSVRYEGECSMQRIKTSSGGRVSRL